MSTTTLFEGISRQWNLANTATATRVALIAPFVFSVFYGNYTIAFWCTIVAGISDLEGYLARFTKTTTPLGRVFDPIADKLFLGFALLALGFAQMDLSILVLWAVALGYDIDNTTRRLREISEACLGRTTAASPLPVTWVSKCKTALLFGVVLIQCPPTYSAVFVMDGIGTAMTLLATGMVGWSWWNNRKETIRQFLKRA